MTEHKYGPRGHIIAAFIKHLERMTRDDWDTVWSLENAAWKTTNHGDWYRLRDAGDIAAWDEAGVLAHNAAHNDLWDAGGHHKIWTAVYGAATEIQGADLMRERGQPFFFLPMFGFADEQAVIVALQPKEGEG